MFYQVHVEILNGVTYWLLNLNFEIERSFIQNKLFINPKNVHKQIEGNGTL